MQESLSVQTHRRNVLFLSLTEVFWGVALGLIHTQAIVTAFLDDLKASGFFVGLVNMCYFVPFALSQVVGGYLMERAKRRKKYVLILHFLAPIPWVAIFVATLLLVDPPRGLVAGRLAVLFATLPYGLLMGILVPVYFAFISAVVLESRRGHAMGTMFAAQCICGALTVFYVGRLTARCDFPTNYALLFAAASAIVTLGNFFLFLTKEPQSRKQPVLRPLKNYLADLIAVVRHNSILRRYILARYFLVANGVLVFFFVKEAKTAFGLEGTDWARLFAFFFLIGQATGNQIFGRIADKVGYVEVALGGAVVAICGGLLAVFGRTPSAFLVAQIAAGVYVASDWLSHMNIAISFAEPNRRAHYIGITNVLVAPVYGVAMLLAGYILDKFHLQGLLLTLAPFLVPGALILLLSVRPYLKKNTVSR